MTGHPAAVKNPAAPPSRFSRFKAKHRKSFVVDMDGALMRRHAQLTCGARSLYSTLRALADAKTGRLAVNGRPLDWKFICREAEISRCTWLKRFKELVTAELAGSERPRVLRVIKGRKRVVLGRACYFVRRQAIAPEIAENQPNLLKSTSSTVEEVDPQISSNHQSGGVRSGVQDLELESSLASSHHPQQPQTVDDDAESSPENPTPNPNPPYRAKPNPDRQADGRAAAIAAFAKEQAAKTGAAPETFLQDARLAADVIDTRRTPDHLSKPKNFYLVSLRNYFGEDIAHRGGHRRTGSRRNNGGVHSGRVVTSHTHVIDNSPGPTETTAEVLVDETSAAICPHDEEKRFCGLCAFPDAPNAEGGNEWIDF